MKGGEPRNSSCSKKKLFEGYYPVDTARKLNVHKTLRRRPGRILNVLCTFNLLAVSRSMFKPGNICSHFFMTLRFFISRK